MEFEDLDRPLEDHEYPDEDDDVDGDPTVPCPACGDWIYEDTPQCPSCGCYVTQRHHPLADKPLWWIVLALAGVLAVIAVLALSIPH